MIIEDLIRTGRLLQDGGLSTGPLLELISDVKSARVRGFFEHVFVVEIPPPDSQLGPVALPMQVWGSQIQLDPKKKKTVFEPDVSKTVGAPFVFPDGNPTQPQGVYGIPVFAVFESHLNAFRSSASEIDRFLQGRLKRCQSLRLSEETRLAVAQQLFDRIAADNPQSDGKTMCLIVLADPSAVDAPYRYIDHPEFSAVGASQLYPGRYIQPVPERIASLYCAAKFNEGAEHGARTGECSFCGKTGDLVSIYCKSWPWFKPTWTCPLPDGGNKDLIVEQIAVDEPCYSALNCGASYFDKITAPIDSIVTRELFSPVADREAQRTVEHRSIADLPTIRGAILLLPILELQNLPADERSELGENLSVRLNPAKLGSRLQKHVDCLVGFNASLPDDVNDDVYRLTLIYYHGDPGRGDIHLRAVIEDVLPSAVRQLTDQIGRLPERLPDLLRLVLPGCTGKQQAYYAMRFRMIPFLLARGYGGPYMWEQLQRILRRQPLDLRRPTSNVVHRIGSLVRRLPKTESDIREEVLFYLVFLDFLLQYNQTIARGGTEEMPMRNWTELLEVLSKRPPDDMDLNGVAEVAFACGYLVRQFGRQYLAATKGGKDYLQHRVLAFGSELTPDVTWKKALPGIFNVAGKLKIPLKPDLRRRIGIVLNLCENLQDNIRTERDRFMAAFWSGYALQHSDPKPSNQQPQE
jgi:hypothetical protein